MLELRKIKYTGSGIFSSMASMDKAFSKTLFRANNINTADWFTVENNFVVEGWAAFHFIPKSVKIFLEVNENVAAERIFKNQRLDEKRQNSLLDMKRLLKERLIKTDEQFKKYYQINFLDKKNFDVIIDTTDLTVRETTDKVLGEIKAK